jgi:hypothetical protein
MLPSRNSCRIHQARRVDDAQARIHQREGDSAEAARKVTKYVSLGSLRL